MKSFLSDVFIYEEEQKDGRILKGLRFKFPIYLNGRDVFGVDWGNESTVESALLLSERVVTIGSEKIMSAAAVYGANANPDPLTKEELCSRR